MLYAYSATFEYVLDDQIVLTNNTFTKKGFDGIYDIMTKESFVGRFGEQKNLVTGARYRPLSIVTFAMEYQFFGANSVISHSINVLLYALLGLLLFRILSLFFPLSEEKAWYFSVPFLATLLFVVHPIHTEVVANVKGRDEIMTLLGALGALYGSYKFVFTKKSVFLFFSFCTFFLALLSKENALTFLAVIPLSLYFFTETSFKKIGITLLPLLTAAII
ncbi:MAG: tetratricopeptide repeat protein, partial [Bacteroidota bacterium]